MTDFIRHRMSLDMADFVPQAYTPGEYRIVPITTASVDDLAQLSVDCYINTPDWDLVPELQTFEGCRKFVSDLFSGREAFLGQQGTFRGDLSYALYKGDVLSGACYTLFSPDTAFIIDFAVAPEVRGQGVGRMFLGYALEKYKEAGYRCAVLYVTADNQPAVRLYTRLGFKIDNTHTHTVV